MGMQKFVLNSRMALYNEGRRLCITAPFTNLPDGVYPVWVSRSGLSAVLVTQDFGWRTLPVVRADRAFAGRLLVPVRDGDEVLFVDRSGQEWLGMVRETPQGWGLVGETKVPLWREGVAVHPSGLLVNQRGEYLLPKEDPEPNGSSSDEEEDDDDI